MSRSFRMVCSVLNGVARASLPVVVSHVPRTSGSAAQAEFSQRIAARRGRIRKASRIALLGGATERQGNRIPNDAPPRTEYDNLYNRYLRCDTPVLWATTLQTCL